VRLRKVTGRIPTREELKGAFIVSNHTMTGDPGLLHFMLADNARVVHKKNVGSFDIITRHKIQVGDDKAEVRETILQGIKNDPTPIIIYPEGATTNGQVGLLRYAAFIFGLNRPVHPVGLRCVVRIKAYYRARGCHAERKRRSSLAVVHCAGTTRRSRSSRCIRYSRSTRSTCSSSPSSRGSMWTPGCYPW